MKKLYLFLNAIIVLFIIFFNCDQSGSSSGGGGGGTSSSSLCGQPADESILTISVDFGELTGYYTEYNELCQPSLGAWLLPGNIIKIEYGGGFAQITPVLIYYPIWFYIIVPSTELGPYSIEEGAQVYYQTTDGSEKRFVNFKDDEPVTLFSIGNTEGYTPNYVFAEFHGSLRAELPSGDYEYIYIDAVCEVRVINP